MWAKPKKMLLTYADAYNFALDRLAMRDHSSLELRDKLAERGCDKELQDRVLAALRERHFVDDVRCAGYVVDAWRRKGIYGRNYLRLMLEKRQIPASVVKDMLDGVSEEEERERAEEFARKEVPKLLKNIKRNLAKAKRPFQESLPAVALQGSVFMRHLLFMMRWKRKSQIKKRKDPFNRDPSFFCYKKEKGPETPFD